ncbi:hypothetical protein BDK51DRAFT_47130 [Blyttiomyces helicus]|uniref:Uncharacterized protein n=1 Tax=Blyttiomyces helicus TaxID=388810 RepID=A0A4P9VZ22_9FUNG|nr:hypothetical protein BDK51DRAFT_47130 [Blyttiomyces helicus]|eukprot:RKO84023.1 hypothetical protein BDK51DRAFT_47130 [Blyttiomyces helicus]
MAAILSRSSSIIWENKHERDLAGCDWAFLTSKSRALHDLNSSIRTTRLVMKVYKRAALAIVSRIASGTRGRWKRLEEYPPPTPLFALPSHGKDIGRLRMGVLNLLMKAEKEHLSSSCPNSITPSLSPEPKRSATHPPSNPETALASLPPCFILGTGGACWAGDASDLASALADLALADLALYELKVYELGPLFEYFFEASRRLNFTVKRVRDLPLEDKKILFERAVSKGFMNPA